MAKRRFKIRNGGLTPVLRYWDFIIEELLQDMLQHKDLAEEMSELPDFNDTSTYFGSPDAADVDVLLGGAFKSENSKTPGLIIGGDGVGLQSTGQRKTTIIGVHPVLPLGTINVTSRAYRVLIVREGPHECKHTDMLLRRTLDWLKRVAPFGACAQLLVCETGTCAWQTALH